MSVKRRKWLQLGLVLLALLVVLVGVGARERIALNASEDSWINYGADIIWYSDYLSTETATIEGSAGNASFDGTLNADGAATLNSTLDVDGNVTSGTGAFTVADTINVTGAADFDSTVNVDGATWLTGTLTAAGAVDLDSTLDVDGAATLNSTLDVDGAVSSGTGAFTVTDVQGMAVTTGGILVEVGGIDVNGTLFTLDADADTTVGASLDDVITATIGAAAGGVKIVTGNLWVGDEATCGTSMNGEDVCIGGAFEVNEAATFDSTAEFNDFIDVGGIIRSDTGAITMTDSLGVAVTQGGIAVVGASTLSGDFTQSDGDLVVADDIIVTAQTAITVEDTVAFTPTGTYQPLTSAGTVTPTITVGTAGQSVVLINESNTSIVIEDAGVQMLTGDITLGQYDVLELWCDGTNWIERGHSNN